MELRSVQLLIDYSIHGLTSKDEKNIDALIRKLLRIALNIFWH